MTGKVFSRYTNDGEGKLVQSISYTYSGNKTTATTTKRKYDVNGYVTEEKTDVASFRTVSGMTILCPDFGVTDTKNYTYDYTAEVPQLISCESMDGTTVDYMYGNGRVAAIVTNVQGDDGDNSTNGFRQSYNLSTDKNGTTMFATDRDGNIAADTTYGTWAEVLEVTKIAVSDTIDADITTSYTGYVYSEEQNHWNAGERIYSATERHFTSTDPEAGNVYEKMRVNAYVYAGNNPVTNTDPDGRSFIHDAFDFVSDKVSSAWNYVTDKASDVWNHVSDGISYIGSAVSGTFDKLACALHTTKSDIAGKLLIGTIGIAVAVATTAVTGGLSLGWAAATVGAEVFTGAAIGAVIGGTVYTAIHSMDEYKLEDCLAEMGNGLLDGYAVGGAVSGVKGLFSLASSWVKTGETTAKFTEVVESGSKTMSSPYDLQPTHSQTLSKNKMNKLIEDIKNNGISETIKYVEYNGQKYVVDGHHRLIAAKRLGLEQVPIEQVEIPYSGYKTIEDLLWFD